MRLGFGHKTGDDEGLALFARRELILDFDAVLPDGLCKPCRPGGGIAVSISGATSP